MTFDPNLDGISVRGKSGAYIFSYILPRKCNTISTSPPPPPPPPPPTYLPTPPPPPAVGMERLRLLVFEQ